MTEHVDTEREEAPKKVKRDRTHWLYILVIIGVVNIWAAVHYALASRTLRQDLADT